MVPMHAKKRKGAFNEPHEFRVHAPIESGGAPPHSKTLARWPQSPELPPGFGVRRRCGALDFPGRFMVPMHDIEVVEVFQHMSVTCAQQQGAARTITESVVLVSNPFTGQNHRGWSYEPSRVPLVPVCRAANDAPYRETVHV